MPKKVLTKVRRRFISSLSKHLILVVFGAAFGGETIFRLGGIARLFFIMGVVVVVLVLFSVGVWLAVDDNETEGG